MVTSCCIRPSLAQSYVHRYQPAKQRVEKRVVSRDVARNRDLPDPVTAAIISYDHRRFTIAQLVTESPMARRSNRQSQTGRKGDDMTTGKLSGICVRPAEGAPVKEVTAATIQVKGGLEEDYRRSGGARAVTVLAREDWEAACREAGADLPWTTRRANLLVEGVPLRESKGQHLRIGPVLLEITGETQPCNIMEAAHSGLREALEPAWRGGVTCRVLEPGRIRPGDPVTLEEGSEM
jgi:MOSC domain-containing protein YiiM